jgi:hypothetical protein
MRTTVICLAVLGVVLWVSGTHAAPPASYETVVLAEYTGLAQDSRILSLGDGSFVVAWKDPQGVIRSRSRWDGVLQPVVQHGTGTDPVPYFGTGGVSLAWASGSQVFVRRYQGVWSPAIPINSTPGVTAHHPDFCYSSSDYGPDIAWLAGNQILFSEATSYGDYSEPEVVASDAPTGTWLGLQLVAVDTGSGTRPRVYYVGDPWSVRYRERIGPGQWTDAILLPDANANTYWPFRVGPDGDALGPHRMLHLGIPPACPCNSISFVRETGVASWTTPYDLTVRTAAFTWPQYLGLAVGPDGTSHCFWYQEFLNDQMQPTGEGMFYRTYRSDIGWIEPFTFDTAGYANDVSVGECIGCLNRPEFCWIEKTGGGSRVMALRSTLDGSSAEVACPIGRLTVVPNPTSGHAVIAGTLPTAGSARLEVFDSAGRLVRSLTTAGTARLEWDGRCSAGDPAAAGVYHLRVVTSAGVESATLVRVR